MKFDLTMPVKHRFTDILVVNAVLEILFCFNI